MNWWLIVVAGVISLFVLALIFYLMMLFMSPDDKNQAWLPKIIVVIGLCLACFNVLLLPYDVANRFSPDVAGSAGGGIDVVLVWQIVMWTICVFTFVIVPFAMFYYESMDPDQPNICNQLRPAFCYTTIAFFIFAILLVVLWITLGTATIPYTLVVVNATSGYTVFDPLAGGENYRTLQTEDETSMDIKVSIFVYMVGLMSAVGWILFFFFGGVGLASLPYDFVENFIDRPKPITRVEYDGKKDGIGRECLRLVPIGKKLEEEGRGGNTGKKHKKKVAIFKRQVGDLERAHEKLEICYRDQGGSVLKAWLGLIVGIMGIVLSLAWYLHIILNNAAQVTPFLNSFFIALDGAFGLLGVMAYGIFAFYLLWCVVKGCTKFGLNFIVFTVHPMKINGTLMNSFLFNTLLIMIASVSTVQFCSISFREYAANTSVDALFTTYVQRLKGINYITMYLQYPMIAITGLTIVYLFCCQKRCRAKEDEDDDDD